MKNELLDYNKTENYKGIFYNNEQELKYYESGAHFSYKLICSKLDSIIKTLSPERRGSSNLNTNTISNGKSLDSITNPETRKIASGNSKEVLLKNNQKSDTTKINQKIQTNLLKTNTTFKKISKEDNNNEIPKFQKISSRVIKVDRKESSRRNYSKERIRNVTLNNKNTVSLLKQSSIKNPIKLNTKIFDTPMKVDCDSVLNSERSRKTDIYAKLNTATSNKKQGKSDLKNEKNKILLNKKKIMNNFEKVLNINSNKSRNTIKVRTSFELKSAENHSSNKVMSSLSNHTKNEKSENKKEEQNEGKKTISFNFFHKICPPNKQINENGKRYESVQGFDLRKRFILQEKKQNNDFNSVKNVSVKRNNLSKENVIKLFNRKLKDKIIEKPFQNKTVFLNLSKLRTKLNK